MGTVSVPNVIAVDRIRHGNPPMLRSAGKPGLWSNVEPPVSIPLRRT